MTFLWTSHPIRHEKHELTNNHKFLSSNVTPLENPPQNFISEMTAHQKMIRLIYTCRTKITIQRRNMNSLASKRKRRRDPIETSTPNKTNNFKTSNVQANGL